MLAAVCWGNGSGGSEYRPSKRQSETSVPGLIKSLCVSQAEGRQDSSRSDALQDTRAVPPCYKVGGGQVVVGDGLIGSM